MTEELNHSNDTTQDLTPGEKLILAELKQLRLELGKEKEEKGELVHPPRRVAQLSNLADSDSRYTQLIIEAIYKELAGLRFELTDLRRELRLLNEDIRAERKERLILAERVELLELGRN